MGFSELKIQGDEITAEAWQALMDMGYEVSNSGSDVLIDWSEE